MDDGSKPLTLRELTDAIIAATVLKHDGDKPAAAMELGISLRTVYNRMNAIIQGRADG